MYRFILKQVENWVYEQFIHKNLIFTEHFISLSIPLLGQATLRSYSLTF